MEDRIRAYIERFNIDSFMNKKMIDNLRIFDVPAHENVFLEKSRIRYFHFLVEGQLSCTHYHSNGALGVIALTNPFAVIGDVEVLDDAPASSLAVTTTLPSVLLGLPLSVVKQFGLDDPLFLRFIIEQLSDKIRSSNSLRIGYVLPVKSRLALYIMSRSEVNEGQVLILPDKETLAPMLGTTTRHLNRVISDLIGQGALGKGYAGVRIKNLKLIREICEG